MNVIKLPAMLGRVRKHGYKRHKHFAAFWTPLTDAQNKRVVIHLPLLLGYALSAPIQSSAPGQTLPLLASARMDCTDTKATKVKDTSMHTKAQGACLWPRRRRVDACALCGKSAELPFLFIAADANMWYLLQQRTGGTLDRLLLCVPPYPLFVG
jgi:hypothetical protein